MSIRLPLVVALLGLTACQAQEPAFSRRRVSVILVSLDTLRADFVGADGTRDAGTPVLDRLAAGGIWYERAYSPSTWTIPSHIAMLSGVYPEALPLNWQEVLETLPKTLRAAGYLTGAFTGGGFMSPQWGFKAGFDTFHAFTGPDDVGTCVPSRFDGSEGFTRAATWIREHAEVPFFLFLHTYDIHDDCPFAREGKPMEAGARAAHYRGLVAETDARLGRLLDAVTEAGIAATTLVVVTSDHGEGLGEHGFFGHGCRRPPYEELTRVPLVVYGPGVHAARVTTPVSVVDIAPTVLGLLDVPVPGGMQGRALPGLGLPAPASPPPVFVHCEDWLAAHVGSHKLITSRSGRVRDRVFDLDADPAERTDVSESVPEVTARLRTAAAAYWETCRALQDARAAGVSTPGMNERDVPPGVDEQTLRRLRDLGYVDQAGPPAR